MNNLKSLSIYFVVFFGVAVAFTMSGVRDTAGMNPYAVDALVAASSAVITAFLLSAMRGKRR